MFSGSMYVRMYVHMCKNGVIIEWYRSFKIHQIIY